MPEYSTAIFSADAGYQGAFAFHPSGNSFFHGGSGGAYNDFSTIGLNAGGADSIAEFSIPELTLNADMNDRTGFQTAAQLQPWSSVFKDENNLVKTDEAGGAHTITGLFFDRITGLLCAQVMQDYDVFPYSQDNVLCYTDSDNLHSSPVNGYYSVRDVSNEQNPGAEAAHAATWMADIPIQWQTTLGGRILFGGGQNFSIVARLPAGMTLFAGTLDNLPNFGHVPVNRWMDFWDLRGKQMGAYLFPDRVPLNSSWYQHEYMNCDRMLSSYDCAQEITESALVVPWNNNWQTILSFGVQGFIVPNTRTYVVIGTMEGGEFGASYKGNPDYRKTRCTGPCRVVEDDRYNKYWLFDINDMVDPLKQPWEVFPYEHGYIPFLDQMLTTDGKRSLMINAGFDLHTGQLAIVMKERHGNFSRGQDALIFSLQSWAETIRSDLIFNDGFE